MFFGSKLWKKKRWHFRFNLKSNLFKERSSLISRLLLNFSLFLCSPFDYRRRFDGNWKVDECIWHPDVVPRCVILLHFTVVRWNCPLMLFLLDSCRFGCDNWRTDCGRIVWCNPKLWLFILLCRRTDHIVGRPLLSHQNCQSLGKEACVGNVKSESGGIDLLLCQRKLHRLTEEMKKNEEGEKDDKIYMLRSLTLKCFDISKRFFFAF